ncbi:n utilization substance protein b homolog [Phtheirospermum japonicum]|uniref:N utilization substance protein b homolog n=1 Tax=Phtheirospermum japonicum TaxID=374723 RepID=A0A830DN98_9LAMI|nr:n utilization substance protein b homolog [Phtheirospermum japonicum]
MEAGSVVLNSSSSSASLVSFNSPKSRTNLISKTLSFRYCYGSTTSFPQIQLPRLRNSTSSSAFTLTIESPLDSPIETSNSRDMLPKVDKSGRLSSPRAARELALLILYAACLDGSDPVRLFEKRLNARRETGYEFDKGSLMEYDHMSFGGPPVTTETTDEADEILRNIQKESDIEAEVLSAPPKLVYSKLILRFARKLLVAVAEKWDSNVLSIDKIAPSNWKNQPAGRILEFSVLHLAMSEISALGTSHKIVINEAVDLAKRFCDGAAPRIINGCLRTFVKELNPNDEAENVKIKRTV